MDPTLERLTQRIRGALTPDLLSDEWRRRVAPGDPPSRGHCYAASEALYHLYGREHGYRPKVMRIPEGTHWFLQNSLGTVLDPTSDQFPYRPDYSSARGCGFLTREPSRRAREIIRRVRTQGGAA